MSHKSYDPILIYSTCTVGYHQQVWDARRLSREHFLNTSSNSTRFIIDAILTLYLFYTAAFSCTQKGLLSQNLLFAGTVPWTPWELTAPFKTPTALSA